MKKTFLPAVGLCLCIANLTVAQPPDNRHDRARVIFDGRTLEGWKVASEVFFEKHGQVRLVDRQLVLDAGSPGTGIVWQGPMPKERYELLVEAARLDGNDFFCGVTFPVGDEFCTFIAGGWGGQVTGLSNVDGLSAEENATTGYGDFQQGQFYRFRIRVTPERIEVWQDQRRIVNQERSGHRFGIWFEQEPMRPLGIATWYTKAAIRRVELKPLP
ncbi:MAG: hypothetical protein KatS3mg110_4308 [Pirellulaceae bacterium]|nr:MAG: hypothetical protein KatS3mg110_4308 [Pirellulaceae bacterium]